MGAVMGWRLSLGGKELGDEMVEWDEVGSEDFMGGWGGWRVE